MRIGLGLVACVCVVLLISSVTAVPVVTQSGVGATSSDNGHRAAVIAAGLRAVDGQPVDFTNLSTRSVFVDAGVRGFDISLGTTERARREGITTTREGLFTVSTSERARVGRSDDPLDATGRELADNMTAHGYTLASHTMTPYESTVTFADGSILSESHGATLGMSQSADERAAGVVRGRVSQYLFTNTTTGAVIEVIVATPTDAMGEPVGYQTISLARVDTGGNRGSRSTPVSADPTRTIIVASTGAGAGAGVVAGLGTAYALGGTAAVLTELTPLLGGAAAVCCGLSATGVGVVVGIAVGVTVAVAVAGLLTYYYFAPGGADRTAPMVIPTGRDSPRYIRLSDGAVVREDGTVTFVGIPPLPKPLPGTDWVSATRESAINRGGELWMLTPSLGGAEWVKYPSDRRYIAVSQTDSWVAAISMDPDGTTSLEIPTAPGQPAADAHIRSDVAALNAGKNPHHHHHWGTDTTIDPPIPGWKSVVAGTDYGLALTTDGRVFGFGTNKDKPANLPGRYSHITTSTHNGRLENDRYSLGIRLDDGGIDFAGDDPNHIKDDIKKAHLDHVIDVAAGPERAIAITAHGQLRVFGNNKGWDTHYPLPTDKDRTYSAVSAFTPHDAPSVFILGEEAGTQPHVTRTPTSVIATTSLESPLTLNDLTHWQTDVMASAPASAPGDGGRVVGIPAQDSTLDPIVAYGIRVNATSGRCEQFVGRAAAKSDVAPVHALLTAWNSGDKVLDAYLDRTYPFDPNYASQHVAAVHAVTHEPDAMTTVWTATTVSSASPVGMTIGKYWLDRLIANQNWTIYALETEVMPIPGAQAFKSGYVNTQTTVTHRWTGDFAKYDNIYTTPYESTIGPTTIYGSLALGEHTDYHYQYSQSKASMRYLGGKKTARHPTASWQLVYAATDSAGSRGDANPISVIAVKNPPAPNSNPQLQILGTIDTSSDFTIGGLTSSLTVAPLQLNVFAAVV
jgi:hypothetical protein